MKKIIEGLAYVLGNDVDTDQIIPAEHLVYSLSDPEEKKNYGKFALTGVPGEQAGLPDGNVSFTEGDNFESKYSIIIGGKNFGCLLIGNPNLFAILINSNSLYFCLAGCLLRIGTPPVFGKIFPTKSNGLSITSTLYFLTNFLNLVVPK